MKASLQLTLSQQLKMTPQLQQAIKLLQLSAQELETQIIEALESNPLLEREEELAHQEVDAAPNGDQDKSDKEDKPSKDQKEESQAANDDSVDLENVEDWDSMYSAGTGSVNGKAPSDGFDRTQEMADPDEEDLKDHLLWQLHLTPLSDTDRTIGFALIDAINEHGYLQDSIEEIHAELCADLGPDVELELDEVEAMLHRIQHLDPLGCGARGVDECLLIQLQAVDQSDESKALAKTIIQEHLEALGNQDIAKLKRSLKCPEAKIRDAIDLVRSLDPRPGSSIASGTTEYVQPDVVVRKRDGVWQVSLHDSTSPKITINNVYADMISTAKSEDASYMRGQLQEARWLIKSLETRNETLLKVASTIVKFQHEFFEHGPEHMKPLILREVAETIEMHESTVSRVTNRKFMLTPRGVFELKYFFSSHVGTSDGGECSATAIQAKIKKLLDEEPPEKPLSDSKIANILNKEGIDVARRTVAKYRENLGIPSSSKRKRII